jgi:hypothetical protein
MQRKAELVSFNEVVTQLSELLALDTAQLDAVLGGAARPPDCTSYVVCGTYCASLDLSNLG